VISYGAYAVTHHTEITPKSVMSHHLDLLLQIFDHFRDADGDGKTHDCKVYSLNALLIRIIVPNFRGPALLK
jgi:hypothetical protein